MFRLSKLEITGFKSFADYTEIIFTGDGITAIVGPNGCGKSNVSDAISWVLGEQSAKNLRGGEMQDVIFQGSKNRSAGGMAEVILHLVRDESPNLSEKIDDIDLALHSFDEKTSEISFDAFEENPPSLPSDNGESLASDESNSNLNSYGLVGGQAVAPAVVVQSPRKRTWQSKKVSLDFAPGESVTVTRRLYRSGESEYQLNGKNCRLRDINDLFSGTGLSGGHYAIIEQGKIGQILSAKPSERRALIEEAAGVTKFRMRQRAAELRLEAAKTNLRRIADIVSEVERTTNTLRRQAAKTKRYKILRDDYREVLQKLFVGEFVELENSLNILANELEKASNLERELNIELENADSEAAKATENARLAEQFLSDRREQIAENKLRRDRQTREIVYLKERREQLEKQIENISTEIKSLRSRSENVHRDIASLKEKNKAQQIQAAEETSEIKNAEQTFAEKEKDVRQAESQTEKLRNSLLQHSTAFERLREITKQNEYQQTRLTERLEGLQKEGQRAAETEVEKTLEHQKISEQLANQRKNLTAFKEQQQLRLQNLRQLQSERQQTEKSFRETRDEKARLDNRLQTLRELEAKNAFYAPNIQKLFTLQDKIGVHLQGVLGDFLSVPEDLEKAVEAIFGEKLQTVLLKSVEDAERVIEYLRVNNVGRFNFALTESGSNKINSERSSTETNCLVQLVEMHEGFPFSAFEREMKAEVVSHLSAASDNLCVTKDGEIIDKKTFFSVGRHNADNNSKGILGFKRELRELEKNVAKAAKLLETAERHFVSAQNAATKAEEVFNDGGKEFQGLERELLTLEMREKSVVQEIERAVRHNKVVAEETAQVSAEKQQLVVRQTKSLQDLELAEASKIEAEQLIGTFLAELKNLRVLADHANAELNTKRTNFAAANERRRSLSNALRRAEQEADEISNRLARESDNLRKSQADFDTLVEKISQTETVLVTVSDEESVEANDLTQAVENLQAARQKADVASAHLKEVNQNLADARNVRSEMEVRRASLQTKSENLRTNCRNELNATPEELQQKVSVGELFDVTDERREAESLRERLENFGAVNMLALEELGESEERLLFLTSQKKDIVDSINSANEALEEIKRRSRERFQHAFTEINRNFTEIFSRVFGGGSGAMNLLEAEDILESGIEIVAQPPGKRLQSLLLLSGGEKAMTAIALILAIFRYRPSPFCLLDEVDAPLDEANVGRFVENVAAMSNETQFIVITHNKRTMESAKALYGVTMEQAGISKVVSVKFE